MSTSTGASVTFITVFGTTVFVPPTRTTTVEVESSAQASGQLFTSLAPTGATLTSPTTSNTLSRTPIPPSGLSKGAKAGIGVGVVFGVVLLIAVLVFVFFLGRKTARKKSTPTEGTIELKAELHAISRPHELEGEISLTAEERQELERRGRSAEMQGNALIKQMPLTGGEISR
ncbi:hypothetical protein BGZ60DRAFT_530097 [Tricladium varicosporioides]|nr:hypothetical protein BGZ60DRAFT_530097 [Hymenoscyphus varicosporioides]